MAAGRECRAATAMATTAPRVALDQGDQVGEANEQGDDSAVGHAHDPQHDVGDGAGDDADHQVAGHVASDRLAQSVATRRTRS